jgi:hypothetical protein
MNSIAEFRRSRGPKGRDRRRYSYDESTDEPAPLIESEATDIENETPRTRLSRWSRSRTRKKALNRPRLRSNRAQSVRAAEAQDSSQNPY